LISLNISYSWWNSSFGFCRNINVNEVVGVSRLNEPVESFIDSSEWFVKPKENSIRIVNSGCDGNGRKIEYGIWNITLDNNGFLNSFNLIFELNATENSETIFSIYYDSKDKKIVNYSGIEWLEPKYDWRIKTKNYDLNYAKGNFAGFKNFKYIYDGDENTNYAGSYSGGLMSILDIGPRENFSWIYNTSTCIKYKRFNSNNNVTCRICYKYNILSCENEGESEVKGTIGTSRDIFYDSDNLENLYYRTNEDDIIKKSNLTVFDPRKNEFRFGVANSTKGTNIIAVMTNGSYFWNESVYWLMVYNPSVSNDNYGTLPSFSPIYWKTIWIAITNETLEKAYERAANWSIAIDYPLEDYVTIGPEQKQSKLNISSIFPLHNFIDDTIRINTLVSYNNTQISNLIQDDFEIYLDDNNIQIQQFHSFNNGTYLFNIKLSTNNLGSHQLRIRVNYNSDISENSEEVILLTYPKDKSLIITNNDWKNYISAVSSNNPVLIYDSSKKLIDKYIEEYDPDQIFQLGTNLNFSQENYFVDSRETLIKTFFNQTNLIIPLNKKISLKSSFLDLPILFDPSQKTFEYLKSDIIHNFTTIEQVDNLFRQKNSNLHYFILTDPDEEESIFSFSLAKNKDAFVIFSSDNSQQSKNKLINEINQFNLPDSYCFDKSLYLTLIEVPYFSLQDPVDNTKEIISDTPYCDVNDDGYQDLSCGRLIGSPEILSYQIEYSKLYQIDKTALILASYNTPGRYWDVLTAGGTMPNVINAEVELLFKGFDVTRLVEKRSEFDELNFTILDKLNDVIKKLELTDSASYTSLFSTLLGDISKIILVARIGDEVLYSIYEFDWSDSWKSLINLKPEYPKHLPVFNEDNLKEEIKNNQVALYFSKGNQTDWFIPLNSSWYSTVYQEFDPSNLNSNALFYYLRYSDSFGIKDKMLDLGSLSLVSSTSDSYNIYSGQTAYHFFKYFDQPVGKAMLETKNRNYQLSQTDLNKNKIYEKEYYDKILIGDPSLSFDPNVDFEQSSDVKIENGNYIITYSFRPDYDLIHHGDSNFIIFNDTDDYLVDNNKPIIPIYKKTFMLPTNSEILDFTIGLSNKTYDNIDLPIIHPDPEYFTNQTFIGEFPDKFYWNYEIKLLDNRTIFETLFSPVIYYSNNTAKIFDEIEVTFKYKSPIEITRINATNVKQGDPGKITVELFNSFNQDQDVNLSLKIQTDSFEDEIIKQVKLSPGKNILEVDYNNTNHLCKYSISIVVTTEGIVVGPKYTYFETFKESFLEKIWYPISRIFKINVTGFFKQTKSFKEDYTIKKQGDKIILDYKSIGMTIHIEQHTDKTVTLIKTPEGELKIEQKSEIIDYHLSTSEGLLNMIKERGQITQEVKGNEKHLKDTLNKILQLYERRLEKLNLIS